MGAGVKPLLQGAGMLVLIFAAGFLWTLGSDAARSLIIRRMWRRDVEREERARVRIRANGSQEVDSGSAARLYLAGTRTPERWTVQ